MSDDCPHNSISGDNYGEYCNDCGKQIAKYDPGSLHPDRNILNDYGQEYE